MKSVDALKKLAEVTAYQWGLITSAQAREIGVKRLELSRLADSGHLERIMHGVYKDAGSPSDSYEELKAAWLSTDPTQTADIRTMQPTAGIVVAGTSAARLHKIGDFWDDRHEFVSPRRKQSQRPEIRIRMRSLEVADVTLMEGLPTMSIERTLADLLEEIGDQSLVADALKDATVSTTINNSRLQDLLSPLAERNGFKRGDGISVLNRLMSLAGIDEDAVVRQVVSRTALSRKVAEQYLQVNPKAFEAIQQLQPLISGNMVNLINESTLISLASQFERIRKLIDMKLMNQTEIDTLRNYIRDNIQIANASELPKGKGLMPAGSDTFKLDSPEILARLSNSFPREGNK